jgi:formylglycine-generating enzyme required for sulfatase activity
LHRVPLDSGLKLSAMNEFNLKLEQAKSGQRKLYILIAGVLILSLITMTTFIAYSNGTSIIIKPDDASKIAKVKIIDGIGLAISRVVYSLTGESNIAVTANGFKSETRILTADNKGGNLLVTLAELPGHLIAATTPENETTRWKIDGQRIAIAAALERKLPSGNYALEIDSRHFEVEKRNIQIERGKKQEVLIRLQPVEGQLNIGSKPEGANVRVNDADVGQTPITLEMKGGKHRLEVGGNGYKTTNEILEITNLEQTIVRNYRLQRKTAIMKFRLQPPRGTLLVNGRKTDPNRGYSVSTNVDHTIAYSLRGYFSKTQKIKLTSTDPKTIHIRLKAEIGEVKIQSEPPATVNVDGKKAGQTPIVLKLPSKPHTIRLHRPGYRTIQKEVFPTSQRITVIRETLQTEKTARLSEAPKTYVSSVGVDLILFEPNTFMMGAPRHQKGQRANEFQRKIELTRPFYAAKHEVTNSQYGMFKTAYKGNGGDRFPVTSVSWQEAIEFCNWLSKREKLIPFYSLRNGRLVGVNPKANGYRLLTEAEWEWLARSASRPNQTIFSWGNKSIVPPMAGNIADEKARGAVRFYVPNYTDGFAEMAPVGSFSAEASGVFDLTGNASEWVHDFYSLQPPAVNIVEVDPLGPNYGGAHVVKGSSWRSGTRTTLRPAYRDGLMDRRDDVGFRIGRYL